MSPHDPPKFTWYHISQCISLLLKSSQRRPHRVTFSQCRPSCRQAARANRCLQGQPGTFGGSCRLLRRTLGGWAALSQLGRALKLAPAQVTKAGQVPFSHTQLSMILKSRSRRTVVIFILLGPAGPSSQGSHKKMVYCSSAGLMVYTTFCIHSKLNLAAPDSDMSSSSRISTSA